MHFQKLLMKTLSEDYVSEVEEVLLTITLNEAEQKIATDPSFCQALLKLAARPSKRGRKSRAILIATTFAEKRPLSTIIPQPFSSSSSSFQKATHKKKTTLFSEEGSNGGTEKKPKKPKIGSSNLIKKTIFAASLGGTGGNGGNSKKKPRAWQKNVPITPLEKMIYTNVCANELCKSSVFPQALSTVPRLNTSGSFGWPGPLAFDRADADPFFLTERARPLGVTFEKYGDLDAAVTQLFGEKKKEGKEEEPPFLSRSSLRNMVSHEDIPVQCSACKTLFQPKESNFVPIFFSYHSWIPLCFKCTRA
jgi:hypothetical protein